MKVDLERSELLFEEGYRALQSESKDSLQTDMKFVKPLKKAAKLNNPKAIFFFFFILATGYKDINVELKKGNKILKKAYPMLEKLSIENHDSLATRYLAKYYDIPLCDFVKDDEKVKTLNELADSYDALSLEEAKATLKEIQKEEKEEDIDSSSYDRLVNLISQLNDQQDKYENIEIVDSIKREADNGNIRACIYLGNAYLEGVVVEKDVNLAYLFYQKAEELGSIKAKYLLGYNILIGTLSSSKNISLGLNKIYQAAKAGLKEALCFLGDVYFEGKYVNQDYDKAYFYYQSAASRGDEKAKEAIRRVDKIRGDVFAYKLHS